MILAWSQNAWFRRLGFLALNLLIAVILVLVILPLRSVLGDRDGQIAERQALLTRLRLTADQQARVQEILNHRPVGAEQVEFLNGANEGVISADLQTRLQGMILSAGARVRSVRALPSRTNDQIKLIGASIELFGSIRAVRQAFPNEVLPYLSMSAAAKRNAFVTELSYIIAFADE